MYVQISYSFPYDAHLKILKISFVIKVIKGENFDEVAKGQFFKIIETACWEPLWKAGYKEHSKAVHSISKAG